MKRRLALCALGVSLLAACAGLSGLTQKPEVSLAGLDLVELGLLEQRFLLRLRVQNPNDVALPVRGLTFDVELNGQPFASGLSDRAVVVPRFGEAVLEVKATSNLSGVLRQLRELRRSGRERVDYRIFGRIALDGMGSLPFERKGEIDAPLFDAPRREAPPRPPAQERT